MQFNLEVLKRPFQRKCSTIAISSILFIIILVASYSRLQSESSTTASLIDVVSQQDYISKTDSDYIVLDAPFLRSGLATGTILDASETSLDSPLGAFRLHLNDEGNVILQRRLMSRLESSAATMPEWQDLWWTGTGDGWPAIRELVLNPTGVLLVRGRRVPEDEWHNKWSSILFDDCKHIEEGGPPATISLNDEGILKISSGPNTLCTLFDARYHATEKAEVPSKPQGSLAVVVAGLFRTMERTCASHREKLIEQWPGSNVDVFVYTFAEEEGEAERRRMSSIIEKCYGTRLKGLQIGEPSDQDESFHGVDPNKVPHCGDRLHRLQSQLRTVYRAGSVLQRYMQTNAIRYDYVFRIRPDTDFWGRPFTDFQNYETAANKIMLVHPYGEHYFYCNNHEGRVKVGPSDQIAYGRLSAMTLYMRLYDRFSDVVRISMSEPSIGTSAKHDSAGHTGAKITDLSFELGRVDYCAIECIVSYMIVLDGLDYEVNWTTEQNLLR